MDASFAKSLEKKHKRGIESKKSMYGRMFILPWCIGMAFFFIVPVIQSLLFSFSYVTVEPGFMAREWAGLEHYNYILNVDPNYTENLSKALGDFFRSMPIVVIVSLILALVLNQKFRGRVFFRAIFFLPVIVATGVVMQKLTQSYGGIGAIVSISTDATNVYTESNAGMDFTAILNNLNLSEDLTNEMSKLITNIFNTLWSCGIPVVLFIAGLQTIPDQLYEASHVEGATTWEDFWYITLPMLSSTLLLVIVFTMIDLLTQNSNLILAQAYDLMNASATYDLSAAMLWFFFGIIGVAIGIVLLLYSKLLLKRWN